MAQQNSCTLLSYVVVSGWNSPIVESTMDFQFKQNLIQILTFPLLLDDFAKLFSSSNFSIFIHRMGVIVFLIAVVIKINGKRHLHCLEPNTE